MTQPVALTQWLPTACILCECNCGIEVALDGRTLAKIRGDKAHPSSQGYTCEKPLRLDRYQNGPHRLDSPMRRRGDGTFEAVGWDTAIAEIAQRLGAVRDEHGGESVFFYGGGGQGNHLGGFFMRAAMTALGAKFRSNALAQEKTGEFWVDAHLYGGHTRGDFDHAEVSVFLGKNPWMSHGLPRARPALREISRDPNRSMIVIDPRRTETAALADHHLALRPGTDAWCLAALAAVLVQEDLLAHDFLAERTNGATEILEVLRGVPVDDYAAVCRLSPDAVRAAARRIGAASSVSIFEDLGSQQAPHSTLSSYLNKLIWLLVGSFGKPGGMAIHTDLVPLTRADLHPDKVSPVLGAPVIAGLIPANVVAEEILTDHPARYRAMVVQSANPAHSVADSATFRAALDALDFVVTVDVAMTETGRLSDYVLPASSQFEKPECTWFNFEFPHNGFHLRTPIVEPLPGTLSEAEIWSRVLDALGSLDGVDLDGLANAARAGRAEFGEAFAAAAQADPRVAAFAPIVLYRTLGAALPDGMAPAAALWTVAGRAAATYPDAVRRAGHGTATGSTAELAAALFDDMVFGDRGIVFSEDEHEDVWSRVGTPDGRINLVIPELLLELGTLATGPSVDAEFPLVLAAGERRAFTANTIFRDPSWRRRDVNGGLRISPADAAAAGVAHGELATLTTRAGRATVTIDVDDSMPEGAIALPNGLGLDEPGADGATVRTGAAPNDLTSAADRDPIAGTPWHKHVPARLEPLR
ncbi:MAG: molybdopterin-dependent oxidoreductase [Sporichthyaceae bacterium]